MKRIIVLLIAAVFAGNVYGQIQVEAYGGIGFTGIDLESWYGGGVNDWNTMMSEGYIVIYPLHFGSLSVGAEVGYQYFFWYTVPVPGYSWVYEYNVDAIRVMGLARSMIREKGFAEVGLGAFLFGDWVDPGVMAALGYRFGIGEKLAVPVKFRAEFVVDRDASPVVVGLSGGISYTF